VQYTTRTFLLTPDGDIRWPRGTDIIPKLQQAVRSGARRARAVSIVVRDGEAAVQGTVTMWPPKRADRPTPTP
jgi:hypothetical protein